MKRIHTKRNPKCLSNYHLKYLKFKNNYGSLTKNKMKKKFDSH